MCLTPKAPKPQIVESTDPRASAAANAQVAARRSAFGYDSTIQGGALTQAATPSLSTQVLLGR